MGGEHWKLRLPCPKGEVQSPGEVVPQEMCKKGPCMGELGSPKLGLGLSDNLARDQPSENPALLGADGVVGGLRGF